MHVLTSNFMMFYANLHSLSSRSSNSSDVTNPSSHVNLRFLSTPEKISRIQVLQKQKKSLNAKIKRLKLKLQNVIQRDGVILDEEISSDMEEIMKAESHSITSTFPKDSFQHIFWSQQQENIHKEGSHKNGIRWHPLIIKLCLYLRHQSSKAYESLRSSGCLALPSQRTLRDYSNAVRAVIGFSKDVDMQLLQAASLKTSPDYHKLVIILIDEMHVKEELVYSKHDGRLIGFVDLGNINNHLAQFEASINDDSDDTNSYALPLANSIITFMVKGLFTSFQYSYTQFPCSALVGEQMFNLFWETVMHLERIGFKVTYVAVLCF